PYLYVRPPTSVQDLYVRVLLKPFYKLLRIGLSFCLNNFNGFIIAYSVGIFLFRQRIKLAIVTDIGPKPTYGCHHLFILKLSNLSRQFKKLQSIFSCNALYKLPFSYARIFWFFFPFCFSYLHSGAKSPRPRT